jgi:hypothetical protein
MTKRFFILTKYGAQEKMKREKADTTEWDENKVQALAVRRKKRRRDWVHARENEN